VIDFGIRRARVEVVVHQLALDLDALHELAVLEPGLASPWSIASYEARPVRSNSFHALRAELADALVVLEGALAVVDREDRGPLEQLVPGELIRA
jgi:hypothetical protein